MSALDPQRGLFSMPPEVAATVQTTKVELVEGPPPPVVDLSTLPAHPDDDRRKLVTLDEARQYIEARLDDGVECPCCAGRVQRYRRTLNKTMIAGLLWLVEESVDVLNRQWVRVSEVAPKWLLRTNQLSMLQHFGLIEKQTNDDPAKRSSGIWRPTEKGRAFAAGGSRVPRGVFLLHNQVEGFTSETVYLSDVVDSFDFRELMEGK